MNNSSFFAVNLPHLAPARCTGCGRCVAVCPTDCLEMAGYRFPPLTRPVLEEIVGGMMTAVIARTRPGWHPPAGKGEVIDLAEEGQAE